ncbi:MAG TPA: hypothetical protein VGC27_01320, partial [Rhizomicrobium sp.]
MIGGFPRLLVMVCAMAALAIFARADAQTAKGPTPPAVLTADQDHQRLMDLLHIMTLRPGANGSDPASPNAANYDEARANPYPVLPDPLKLNNGKPVTTAAQWWSERRPQIVADFDREMYGRVPTKLPAVRWELTGTTSATIGTQSAVTKRLLGHVDNSSYPPVKVGIA